MQHKQSDVRDEAPPAGRKRGRGQGSRLKERRNEGEIWNGGGLDTGNNPANPKQEKEKEEEKEKAGRRDAIPKPEPKSAKAN